MRNSLISIFIILFSVWSFAEGKGPYQILGIPQNASLEQIKSAYRKLAMKHHPDRNSDQLSSQKFIEIKQAYEVLIKNYNKPSESLSRKTDLGGGFSIPEIFDEKEMVYEMLKEMYPRFFDQNFLFENKESYSQIGSHLRANKKLAYQAILSSNVMARKNVQSSLITYRSNMMNELKATQNSSIKYAPVSPSDAEADSFLIEIALSRRGYKHADAFEILLYLNKPQVSNILDNYIDFLAKAEAQRYYSQSHSIRIAFANINYQLLTFDKVFNALKRPDITQVGLNELINIFNYLDTDVLKRFKNPLIEILPTLDVKTLGIGSDKKNEVWKKILKLAKNDIERKVVLEKMIIDKNEFSEHDKIEFSSQLLKISPDSNIARDTLFQIHRNLIESDNRLMKALSLDAGIILVALDSKYAYLLGTLLTYPLDSYRSKSLVTLLSLNTNNKKLLQIIHDYILKESKGYSKGAFSFRLSTYILKEFENRPLPKILLDIIETNIGKLKDLSTWDDHERNEKLLGEARSIQLHEGSPSTCNSLFL